MTDKPIDTSAPKSDAVEDFAKKSTQLKQQFRRLSLEITDGDAVLDATNEEILSKTDRVIQTLTALRNLKQKQYDEYRCPLSNQKIKDPVVLTSSRTYDRSSVENWLKDLSPSACPQTRKVLSDLVLIRNKSVQQHIIQWFKDQGLELPPPLEDINVASPLEDINVASSTDADSEHISSLFLKLSSTRISDQEEAAEEICKLTAQMPSCGSFFGEYSEADAMTKLLAPLGSPETLEDHPYLQEDLIAAVLNVCISVKDDNNKKMAIARCPCVVPLLIESLKVGTPHTRTNAAAALSSLSEVDDNRHLIGELDALRPLLDLLGQEQYRLATKDVACAILNLCKSRENRNSAVNYGAVKVTFDNIKEHVYVSEMLAILSLLSGNSRAADELQDLNAVGSLLSIIRESKSETDLRNCILILDNLSRFHHTARRNIWDDESMHGTISKLAKDETLKEKANAILDRVKPNKRKAAQ